MMKALVYRGSRGKLNRTQWRCRITGENSKIIFISSEGYNNQADLLAQLDALKLGFEVEVAP